MWTCPHCGAPQAEAARCWVCRRSSTTCSTCRHFRPSLTAELGYCGKDRRRAPLSGLELRGCWEEGPRRAAEPSPDEPVPPRASQRGGGPLDRPDPLRLRGFVPIEELLDAATRPAPGLDPIAMPMPPLVAGPAPAVDDWAGRTSLFGDAEA